MTLLEALVFGYYNELSIEDLEFISDHTKYRFEINDGEIVGMTK